MIFRPKTKRLTAPVEGFRYEVRLDAGPQLETQQAFVRRVDMLIMDDSPLLITSRVHTP